MNAPQTTSNETSRAALFDVIDGRLSFRGLPVERMCVDIADQRFRVVALKDAADLLDQEEFARAFVRDDLAPFGLELWPAALMLAARVLLGEDGAGRPALDLGCGLGLLSMAATAHGWRVSAVDHDPLALCFAEYNARLNGIFAHEYTLFDWHRPPGGRRYDRVFGADVLYQRRDHAPIIQCVSARLAPGGVALFADPNRSVADAFRATAEEAGFSVSVEKTSTAVAKRGVVEGRVFALRSGAA